MMLRVTLAAPSRERIFALSKSMALASALALAFAASPALTQQPPAQPPTQPPAQQQPPAKPDAKVTPPKQTPGDTYRMLNLFGDVFERVRRNYVEEVTDKQLIEAAIQGMLSSLDPHSSYLDEESFKDMQVQTKGEFGGLGIEVSMENGFIKVISPIDDTPAFRAGVKPGDYITHLDGESVQGLTLTEAVDKMRGKVNTPIKLTVRREGEAKALEISVTRDVIKVQSVKGTIEGDVGVLRITSFNEQTDVGIAKNIDDFKKKMGDKLHGIVLDLRNNPGGLLDQAISVSDDFLDKGEIVSTRGRNKQEGQRYNAKPGDLASGLPIVVLINSGSASASEIVAGALQDHHRAIVMGTKSFGKGSVQTIMPVQGNGAIRLTTAKYYTPSGRSIQQLGIEPDIIVEPVQLAAVEAPTTPSRGEAGLRGALSNDNAAAGADPNRPKDQATKDYQLARAVDLVRGLHLYNKAAAN